jgi:hypothetical protein
MDGSAILCQRKGFFKLNGVPFFIWGTVEHLLLPLRHVIGTFQHGTQTKADDPRSPLGCASQAIYERFYRNASYLLMLKSRNFLSRYWEA